MTYEVDVTNIDVTLPSTIPQGYTYNGWYYPDTSTSTYSYSFSTIVYKYQLICPKCKTTNWGEIDQIVTCTGIYAQEKRPGGKKIMCNATLKAIKHPVDFEIPVG